MKEKKLEPLDYSAALPLEKVSMRYYEITSIFAEVKAKYPESNPNIISRKEKIKRKDLKLLEECIGVILPLSTMPVLREELIENKPDSDKGTLSEQISRTNLEILMYLSEFKNSNVKKIICSKNN